MLATRYIDDFNNVWVLAEHESAVSSVMLAIPTIHWSREVYAAYDLTAELWAHEIEQMLLDLDHALPVHAYSTPDVVAVIVEAGPEDRACLIDTLRRLLHPSVSGLPAPDWIRDAAVSRVYRAASEFSALSSWSPPGHRYAVSVEERVAAIREGDLASSQRTIELSSKVLVAVGGGLEHPDWVRRIDAHVRRSSEDVIDLPAADAVSVVHSRSAELAQVAIVTPGVVMSSGRKGDLHVFWTLMREREGIFYRITRSRGGLIYSIAAFNREYRDSGFGMCVVSCLPTQVRNVVQSAREAAERIASGSIPSAMVSNAIERVGMGRSLAMRNAQAVAKALLASELSKVPPDDYSAQLASVSPDSVAATARSTVHVPGWRIRATIPGDPE